MIDNDNNPIPPVHTKHGCLVGNKWCLVGNGWVAGGMVGKWLIFMVKTRVPITGAFHATGCWMGCWGLLMDYHDNNYETDHSRKVPTFGTIKINGE